MALVHESLNMSPYMNHNVPVVLNMCVAGNLALVISPGNKWEEHTLIQLTSWK